FVFVCTIICFVFLLQTITPLFTQLFLENQLELPIYTQILISLHEKLSQYGAFILFFLFLSLIFIFFQIKSKGFLYQSLLSLLLSLPLFGKITLRTYLYQYCFTLSLLIQAGIDLLSSVLLAQQSISSQSIRHKLSQIHNSLLNGKSFYEGAKICKLFDSLTLSLIVAAQKGENFSQVLHTCAIYYKNQNKDTLDFMIALIEPLFTCLLGIFVLLLALGIFMPIWNLS
ncbi:type II secretion system F family protein, partial [Helicobacter kayseriensis]|uniref:type II secretion system F family protein n=1 Tax=Helicobacter kayseriensis TaxID=2905877 RepID=UPI001E2E33E1